MGAMTARERIEAKRKGIAANRSKGLRPYKFKNGKTSFRILPSADPSADWDRRYGKHYLKSFDGQNFFGIGDNEITYGKTDTVRELIFDAMRQAPDQDTKDHYRKMLASPRHIFGALILDDKDQPANEPVLIEVSEGAFDGILSQFEAWTDEDPDYDLASLANGHVFNCEKSGAGLDTKYVFTATPKKAPLNKAILEKAVDLDGWIQSQFEGLEQKALEFLGRLNGVAGIPMNSQLLSQARTPAITASPSASAAANSASNATTNTTANANTVTTVLDDEPIEDAVVEDVVDDTPAPAEEPVQTTVAPTTPAASAPDSSEIDDILAGLQ